MILNRPNKLNKRLSVCILYPKNSVAEHIQWSAQSTIFPFKFIVFHKNLSANRKRRKHTRRTRACGKEKEICIFSCWRCGLFKYYSIQYHQSFALVLQIDFDLFFPQLQTITMRLRCCIFANKIDSFVPMPYSIGWTWTNRLETREVIDYTRHDVIDAIVNCRCWLLNCAFFVSNLHSFLYSNHMTSYICFDSSLNVLPI